MENIEGNLMDEIYALLGQESKLSLQELFEKRRTELGITRNQVEKLLKMDKNTLNPILDKTAKRVDIINLLKLGEFLNIRPDKLIQLFVADTTAENIRELENVKKANFLVSTFNLEGLKKIGFITSVTDYDGIEDRIVRFFGLRNIYEYKEKLNLVLFSRTRRTSNNKMRDFFVMTAYLHFEKIANPNPYNRDTLKDLVPKIRPYTQDTSNGLLTVARALYNVGVTVICQPHLPTTQVRGATFSINDKPCIVLTDLKQDYATLWFALMHELHHVLFDFDEISTRTYHLTGEPELFLEQEELANKFARDILFSDDKLKYVRPFIDTHLLIKQYAERHQVHPSIIYNFYRWDEQEKGNKSVWMKFNDYFPDVQQAIKYLNSHMWDTTSIEESILKVRDALSVD